MSQVSPKNLLIDDFPAITVIIMARTAEEIMIVVNPIITISRATSISAKAIAEKNRRIINLVKREISE